MDWNPAQLRWRCRRGMRELDAVLQGFLDTRFEHLSDREKTAFAAVLELPDPDIYAYLARKGDAADEAIVGIIDDIRNSIRPPE